MTKIETFEDLIAWQKARQLTKAIYAITRRKTFNTDRSLAHQMQRASVSIRSNIAEGFDRDSPGDFHRFLGMAKGSCGELVAQLFVASIMNIWIRTNSSNSRNRPAKSGALSVDCVSQ